MARYDITAGSESSFRGFFVFAPTPEEAAKKAAHKLHGRRVDALRVTGSRGLSGMFQGYVPARDGGQTSIGGNFHVSED